MLLKLNSNLKLSMRRLSQQLAALVPQTFRQAWQQLPPRDRQALRLLVWVLFLTLLYLLIWQPVKSKIAERQAWETRQHERFERAQLAAYQRLNQFGMMDLLPLDLWLKQELPAYRLSLIRHQPGKTPDQSGQLSIRYTDARQAQQFLVALSGFCRLSAIQVDQTARTISLTYQPDPDYADLVR